MLHALEIVLVIFEKIFWHVMLCVSVIWERGGRGLEMQGICAMGGVRLVCV